MADVAKKGVSTAENSNGFINNVASDTNTGAPGGMAGEGEEYSAGTSSPAAPDLLSFRLPASDEGASLEELIQSELALRIGTANSEEQMDEEEEEQESRREAEMRAAAAEEARVVESMGRGAATDGGKGNSPPVDLLLDFTEPTSPLGGEAAIDMFTRDAEFPEDVLTPEGVSPDEAPPSVAEAVVGVSGRAPWATSQVEEEAVEEAFWEAGEVSDRRVPFIGPAEVSLVDFSTTVTDDSAFDMLTPPTEDKVFGVNIPEIRVDTPPASSPEEEEEVVGVKSEFVEEEEDLQKVEEHVEEDFERHAESVEQEVEEEEEEEDGEDEEEVDGEAEEEVEGEAEEEVEGEAEEEVESEAEEEVEGEEEVDDEAEEDVDGEAEEDVDGETDEDVDGEADVGVDDEVEDEVDDESEKEETRLVKEVEDEVDDEVEDLVGVGGRRVVETYPRVQDEDDGWECVGEISVEGMEEGAVPEGLEDGEDSKGIDEVEVTSDLMREDGIPQKIKENERREEFREVQEIVGDEVLSEDVREAESSVQEEEDRGALVYKEADLIDTEVVKVVNKVEKIGEMIYEEFTVQEDSVEDAMMNEGDVKLERQIVEEVVKKESRKEVHAMDLVTNREEACEFQVQEDKRNGDVVFEGKSAPVKEESVPIGKIVIPSTFGGSGAPPLDDTDRGTSVQHADLSSEFGVPACRPSLVDWNAVVKKEEQKGASGDSVQDVEPPKKAGTRKVKKDSGGEGKKKAKKGKKSDAEKENLSVNLQSDMGTHLGVGFPRVENETKDLEEEGLSGVSIQALKETYCSQASKPFQVDEKAKEVIAASISISDLKRGFEEEDESEGDSDVENDEEEVEETKGKRLVPGIGGGEVERGLHTFESSREAGEDTLEIQADGSSDQNNLEGVKYYRSHSRLEQRTFGSLSVEKRAKSLVDLRRQSEGSHQELDGSYFGSPKREPIVTGVSVKALRASYCNLVNLEDSSPTLGRTAESEQRSSFNKFDQLSKKTVLHVKSVDSAKVQKQFNEAASASAGQGPSLCRSCGKQVFQMEQVKAERAVWHRNCFRCKECSKQLTVDIYSSHEGQLYCKPHFRELFKPKAVVETEDVGPASDKPDLGLEELTSLDVKSRFKVFEKDSADESNANLEKSSSAINVKRSPSILSKLAKFQKKGMDIGVTDDSLNGVPFEQSESSDSSPASSSEDEGDEEGGVVKSSRRKGKRERPVSFGKMDDMKNKWESVGANGVRKTREELREERKEEIQRLRSRLFQGKQGKMKEMYEQAVLESEKGTGATSNGVKRQPSERAKSLKERFEKGEAATDLTEDTSEEIRKEREELARRAKEEELSVFEAGISKKSRSLFLELDKAQKQQNLPPLIPTPKSPQPREEVRKVRETGSPEREVYRDPTVVRCEDPVGEDDAEVVVKSHTTTKMLSLFRQMEENANKEDVPEGPKPLKRFTPPPDYTRDSDSEEEDEEDEDEEEEEEEEEEEQQDDQQNPGIIRSSDKIEDEFLKQAMSQNPARAKSLRAKFERWEAEQEKKEEKENGTLGPEDESPSVDTTRNLRARFESMQSEAKSTATAERRPRVNRFV